MLSHQTLIDRANPHFYKKMTKEEAISAIYNGNLVDCTKEEYPEIRTALQEFAGERIDAGDGIRGQIVLMEVQRLDKKFEK